MKDVDATHLIPPVALTESEIEAVAGGSLNLARLGGCPGCTSGGYFDTRLAAVVNPAVVNTAVSSVG